jgi:hypothetical protein
VLKPLILVEKLVKHESILGLIFGIRIILEKIDP